MKKFLILFALSLSSFSGFSQESPEPSVPQKNHTFFITLGPDFMLNTDSGKESAPSPINFSLGCGMTFLEDKPVQLQPRISFSTNYYLWNGENARPAEIENRTATALNMMLDLDALYTFGSEHKLQIGGGLGILSRFGILSDGVSQDDAGGTATSTAGDDVKSINQWFWSDMRFLYPEIALSYTYTIEKWQLGAETRFYIPLGSLMNGDGMDGFMACFSVKVVFP